jgi:hypothetical protein
MDIRYMNLFSHSYQTLKSGTPISEQCFTIVILINGRSSRCSALIMFPQSFIAQFLHNNYRSPYYNDDRDKLQNYPHNFEWKCQFYLKIEIESIEDIDDNFKNESRAKTRDKIDHKFPVPESRSDFACRSVVSEIRIY